jgi:hypothetical protein
MILLIIGVILILILSFITYLNYKQNVKLKQELKKLWSDIEYKYKHTQEINGHYQSLTDAKINRNVEVYNSKMNKLINDINQLRNTIIKHKDNTINYNN